MSLVNWKDVCQPKKHEGLNLKNLANCNKAFLKKLAWQLYSKRATLWVCVLKRKCISNSYVDHIHNSVGASHLWKGICAVWPQMLRKVSWFVGDGQKVWFWIEIWVGDKPLLELATDQIYNQEIELTVHNFATESGNWIWETFANKLPNNVLMWIAGISTLSSLVGEDVVIQRRETLGQFSVNPHMNRQAVI